MLKIGIAGLGTVGVGVIEGIVNGSESLTARTGKKIVITAVSARSNKDRGVDLSSYTWFDCPIEMAKTADIDVFLELMGGASGTALDSTKQALETGKMVVTANKAMLAEHGEELAKLAENNNTYIHYEAAIAGGIPVVKALREGLAGNEVNKVYGILNGTCNYIFTTIKQTGRDFDDVLKEAQDLGYAEAEPSMDVDGIDAAQKLALIASIAFGIKGKFSDMHIETIRQCISNEDVHIGEHLGYSPKLVGMCEKTAKGVRMHMAPAFVKIDSSLGNVNGVLNACVIEGDRIGKLTLVGPGAGRDATASAVLADIADIASGRVLPVFNQTVSSLKDVEILSMESRYGKYYVRSSMEISKLDELLKQNDISHSHIETENSSTVVITGDVEEKKIRILMADSALAIFRIEEC